jgi:hypothetical protein
MERALSPAQRARSKNKLAKAENKTAGADYSGHYRWCSAGAEQQLDAVLASLPVTQTVHCTQLRSSGYYDLGHGSNVVEVAS